VNGRQVIWLSSTATAFAAACDECLHDPDGEQTPFYVGYRAARVEGTLGPTVDVGFIRCRRGHRIVLRRATRPAALARPSERQLRLVPTGLPPA